MKKEFPSGSYPASALNKSGSVKTKPCYGLELAERVYDYLLANQSIAHNHYGYCGVGFIHRDGVVLYTHIDEWELYREGVIYQPGGDYTGIIQSFADRAAFIGWLAQQSDDSLAGKESQDPWYIHNQRITKSRLLSLLPQL